MVTFKIPVFDQLIAHTKNIFYGKSNIGKTCEVIGIIGPGAINTHYISRAYVHDHIFGEIAIIKKLQFSLIDDLIPDMGVHFDIRLHRIIF
jgi:hypothetical protein